MELEPHHPLAANLVYITKSYIGAVSKALESLPIDRFYYVLLTISENEHVITQQQISEMLQIDKVTAFRVVDYFTKKGLVKRTINKEDRRSLYLHLTAKGKALIPQIKEAYQKINDDCFNNLPEGHREIFNNVITQIMDNLEQMPKIAVKMNYKPVKVRKKRVTL